MVEECWLKRLVWERVIVDDFGDIFYVNCDL